MISIEWRLLIIRYYTTGQFLRKITSLNFHYLDTKNVEQNSHEINELMQKWFS